MKQIDYLISDLSARVKYHSSIGVGTRILVLVASQNESLVLKAAGELAHGILKGTEWDNVDLSATELELRSALLLKDLLYSRRILITTKVKSWPDTVGSHLELDVGNYDRLFYDRDVDEAYLRFLEKE